LVVIFQEDLRGFFERLAMLGNIGKKFSSLSGLKSSTEIIAEITHVAPAQIAALALEARKLGAKIVVVHGETIVEPVPAGTNLAALKSSVDILAHPGLLTEKEARLAADRGIYLEITTRKGHSFTNGHVAQMARKFKAKLILNNDAHSPADFVGKEKAERIARGAGLNSRDITAMFENSRRMVKKLQV
ncbi:MAG: histidinol phosphate phosphatase domain-containing protein, partial [Smithella sp.]